MHAACYNDALDMEEVPIAAVLHARSLARELNIKLKLYDYSSRQLLNELSVKAQSG